MPEKPKPGSETEEKPDESRSDEQTWGEDQKKHRYYYDDAHGYEAFDPEDEDNDADED